MNWYKRYMGDYASKTGDLKMIEHGAYGLLLDYSYAREAPLPADKQRVYVIAKAIERWERDAVDSVLAKFYTLTDAGYIQKRTEEELAKYKKAAAAHSANLPTNLGQQMASQKPETRNQKKPKSSARAKPWPDDFVLTSDRNAIGVSWGILHPQDEWTHFESHHKAKGSRFVDWDRAWVTWCCRARQFNPRMSNDSVRREAQVGAHR